MQGGSQSDSGLINWINEALDANRHHMRLHHDTLQAN